MESVITQLGVGGIFVVLVLREVFSFLKTKPGPRDECRKCARQVQELYNMHNQKDGDGVYVWYVRRSLEDAIIKLTESIDQQTQTFRELVLKLKNTD